jgi:hypothetical protein
MPTRQEDSELAFAGTTAARMLKAGLQQAARERGLSTRAAARELGYKATVVISHMATGRVPVPLDRAVEIAQVVGLDPREFYLAVLEQRFPGSVEILDLGTAHEGGDEFVNELQTIAGGRLTDLPAEHKDVIRDVVCERAPMRRWLTVQELSAMLFLRKLRPSITNAGLQPADAAALEEALKGSNSS